MDLRTMPRRFLVVLIAATTFFTLTAIALSFSW